MNDKEVFTQLLGLIQSWEIAEVQVDYDTLQIHIIYGYHI